MAPSNAVPPGRLLSHFTNRTPELQSAGWSELWETDQSDLWDRGKPSPALIDYVESRPEVLAQPKDGRRLRALVPGCGRGYDVVMLALHGFDAYGLEVSQKAVHIANAYAASQLTQPTAYNFGGSENTPTNPPSDQLGSIKFICGDFFQRDWEAHMATDGGEPGFDLIYDYTFLCALLPQMRKDWARRMRELLSPSGVLVCLEFPLYKDLKSAGPPWGLGGVYWNLLAEGGDGLIGETSAEARGGKGGGPWDRVAYINPSRTYPVGQGTDMLSIWVLKK